MNLRPSIANRLRLKLHSVVPDFLPRDEGETAWARLDTRRHRIGQSKRNQIGFTLVELMIGVTLGLLILAGLTEIFISNSRARGEIEKANRQVENGRFAMQILSEDIRMAGFFGEFDPTVLAAPAIKPDPCMALPADLKAALPVSVQGYDNGANWSCSISGLLSDMRTGTDILVIRRVSTCVVGAADCDAVSAGIPYFQAALCSNANHLGSNNTADYYGLDTTTSNLTRLKKGCATLADLRRYRTHIYFIANNSIGSDGTPTLKRAELDASVSGFTVVPQVEGIEDLQFEYGLDTKNPTDGTPNVFTADPDNYGTCVNGVGANCLANWQNVVAIKVNLLARNTDKTTGYSDDKTYSLGLKADGTTANTFGPYHDAYKRHAFQALVRLDNPAGRKQ